MACRNPPPPPPPNIAQSEGLFSPCCGRGWLGGPKSAWICQALGSCLPHILHESRSSLLFSLNLYASSPAHLVPACPVSSLSGLGPCLPHILHECRSSLLFSLNLYASSPAHLVPAGPLSALSGFGAPASSHPKWIRAESSCRLHPWSLSSWWAFIRFVRLRDTCFLSSYMNANRNFLYVSSLLT